MNCRGRRDVEARKRISKSYQRCLWKRKLNYMSFILRKRKQIYIVLRHPFRSETLSSNFYERKLEQGKLFLSAFYSVKFKLVSIKKLKRNKEKLIECALRGEIIAAVSFDVQSWMETLSSEFFPSIHLKMLSLKNHAKRQLCALTFYYYRFSTDCTG